MSKPKSIRHSPGCDCVNFYTWDCTCGLIKEPQTGYEPVWPGEYNLPPAPIASSTDRQE
jgi:hypothetical protein